MKRTDMSGRDITDLTGLYDQDDDVIMSGAEYDEQVAEVTRLREENHRLDEELKQCDTCIEGKDDEVARLQKRETMAALDEEAAREQRDEAREAARWLWSREITNTATYHKTLERWPWLEEE